MANIPAICIAFLLYHYPVGPQLSKFILVEKNKKIPLELLQIFYTKMTKMVKMITLK